MSAASWDDVSCIQAEPDSTSNIYFETLLVGLAGKPHHAGGSVHHHHHILFAKKGGGLPENPKLIIARKGR